eukprot:7248086-Ditylum_brightwellii.AAC.1
MAVCFECVHGNYEHERGKRGKPPLQLYIASLRERRRLQLSSKDIIQSDDTANFPRGPTISIEGEVEIGDFSMAQQKKNKKPAKSVYPGLHSKHSTKSHSRDFISPGIVLVAKTVPA